MPPVLTLTSPEFADGGTIPRAYTCDGDRGLSPPLEISGVPGGAKSLVLILDDPDVPKIKRPDGMFDHWVLYNIPPTTTKIVGGAQIGTLGVNTAGTATYTGPCPPPEYEPREHRYVFKLYALGETLDFREPPTKDAVVAAMQNKILAETVLIGRYSRK